MVESGFKLDNVQTRFAAIFTLRAATRERMQLAFEFTALDNVHEHIAK